MYRVDSAATGISEREQPASTYPAARSFKQEPRLELSGEKLQGERVKGGTEVLSGILSLPRGTLQSVGPAAMLKPSVGSLSRGLVKQAVLRFDLSQS